MLFQISFTYLKKKYPYKEKWESTKLLVSRHSLLFRYCHLSTESNAALSSCHINENVKKTRLLFWYKRQSAALSGGHSARNASKVRRKRSVLALDSRVMRDAEWIKNLLINYNTRNSLHFKDSIKNSWTCWCNSFL